MYDPHKAYDTGFYERQMVGSYLSASKIVSHLNGYFSPQSVVDVGCGRGTWLKAFKENGASNLVGFDGPWNAQQDMIDQDIIYQEAELNDPLSLDLKNRFDLAVTLEVAEHLKPESSHDFISALTSLSDVVLFSAAYTKQDGKDHINEREHSFWAKLFAEHKYRPFDLFRPVFWGDPDVRFWYQQNCFLYVKDGIPLRDVFSEKGVEPLANLQFMNCVHPRLYRRYIKPRGLKRLIAKVRKLTSS
jgi:SAM-dependent methyltransferase